MNPSRPSATENQPAASTARSSSQPIPLLALHGFTGCGADFQWLATQTGDLFNWHTYDFPGHGANTAPANGRYGEHTKATENNLPQHACRAAATARAIHAALDAIAAANASASLPVLLGYSMGGRMALRTLAQYGTANIRGLILIGASPGLASAAERRTRRIADHALAAKIEAEGIDAFIEHWNKVPIIASQSRSPHFAQLQIMRRRNTAAGLAASLRGIGTGALAPVHQRLPQLRVPCLLLSGEQDTKFTDIAQTMLAALPNASHAIIPNAGHSPHWENETATVSAIRTWAQTQL